MRSPDLVRRRGGASAAPVAILLIATCAATAWRDRAGINTDGLSYLDIAQAVADGRWKDAVTCYWSPLYPWVMGGVLAVATPDRANELLVVKAMHLGILALAFLAFSAFLSEWTRLGADQDEATARREQVARRWLGWAAFGWAVSAWVDVGILSPDLGVAALFLVATTLTLRLRREPVRKRMHAAFGVVLGLGYLGKTALLPLSAVFLVTAYAFNRKTSWRGAAIAVAALVLVAAPHVAAMKSKSGRWTIGDVGPLAYAWLVEGVRETHWQGGEEGGGTPLHPTRRIARDPEVFEFDGPVPGTYPVWYDKAYWSEGVRPTFSWEKQVAAWKKTTEQIGWTVFRRPWIGAAALLFLLVLGVRTGARTVGSRLKVRAAAWIPSAAALALYACVHVEGRYVAAPLLVLALATLDALGVPGARAWTRESERGVRPSVALAAVSALAILGGAALRFRTIEPNPTPQDIAHALSAAGVPEGARVARIGGSLGPYWARIARVRVVGEVREPWAADGTELDPVAWARVAGLLAKLGDGWVVAEMPPRDLSAEGWTHLDGTPAYVRRFPK